MDNEYNNTKYCPICGEELKPITVDSGELLLYCDNCQTGFNDEQTKGYDEQEDDSYFDDIVEEEEPLDDGKYYCEICGKPFQIMDNGWTRKYCYECAPHEDENMSHAQAVTIKRRAIKKALIDYKGGKCCRCGYNKSIRALEFHHLDPNEKDFGISKCITKSNVVIC